MTRAPRRRALLLLLALVAAACSKKVPTDLQPTLDAIRPEARKVADAAAQVCSAQFTSGRLTVTPKGGGTNLLPGETVVPVVPSPAKGTPLELNPLVLEVETSCYAPTGPGVSFGSALGSLHDVFHGPGASRTRRVVEGGCKAASTDCEEVIVPSQRATDERSADLRIVRPVSPGPAGATAEVTVILSKK